MWGVLALWVSQTEPHGMLGAPVGTSYSSWWGCQGPPQLPVPSISYSHHGKMDCGWKLFVGFAIEAKTFVLLVFKIFLMKSHVFPVSLGISPPTSSSSPGSKSPFFTPNSSAEGRGWGLKANPKPKGHSSPHLQPWMWQEKEEQGQSCHTEHEGENHEVLQKPFGQTWKWG